MSTFEKILNLLTEWFGDEFEDGELDSLIFQIIEAVEEDE